MENTQGQNPAKAVNSAETNTNDVSDNFGVEQVENAIRTSLFDDTTEPATYEAENSEESPEVESEGEQDSTSVHSESHEETTEDNYEDESPASEEPSEDAYRGLPKGVKKRIDKLVAKRREAEQEVERMKTELERLSQEASLPARAQEIRGNPYAKLMSPEAIQSEVEKAKQIRRWCEMNPDGGIITDSQGNDTEYTAEQVRNIKVKAMDALEEHLPAQHAYLNNFKQVEEVSSKEYPWWKDKSSRERQIAESFIKHFPEITRFPDYKMVVGDYIRGVKSREASKQNAGQQRLPSQPRTSGAPVASGKKEADMSRSKQRFVSSGGKDDLSDIIASRFL
jgi:hypothetical protein